MSNLKTFREVIRDIKEGEIYTDGCTIIFMKNDKIKIKDVFKNFDESYTYSNDYRKFKLKRKEYSFNEAFKAYEEGEEIESLVNNIKYKNGKFKLENNYEYELGKKLGFSVEQIKEKWYINN